LQARNLLSDEGSWTQGWFAHDAQGKQIDPTDDGACRWCAVGAVRKANKDLGFEPQTYPVVAAEQVLRSVVKGSISEWNDDGERNHSQVLSALDTAIDKVLDRQSVIAYDNNA
jgi:hypothetical protein